SLDNRHALVQLIMIMPENYSGRIALESVVDGRVTNDNTTQHLVALTPSPSPAAAGAGSESSAPSPAAARGGRGFSSPPLPSQQERGPGGQGLLLMRTLRSGYELAFAAHADLRDAMGGALPGKAIVDTALIGQRWEWDAQQGHVYELRKLVA